MLYYQASSMRWRIYCDNKSNSQRLLKEDAEKVCETFSNIAVDTKIIEMN